MTTTRVRLRLLHLAILMTLALAVAPATFAQAVYGSIFGSVTDSTGALVPGATITVTDVSKGTSVTVTANASGDYTVDHLIPDTYDMKVTAAGFKTYAASGIDVNADSARKLVVALQTGEASTTISVDADAIPLLKADRADVSTVFTSADVASLPVGDRNFTNLQLLLPGAQLLGWSHAPDENPQGSRQIQVDGQAFGGVAFELDGTDNQDPILGIIVINPNIDSLSETKITTQNFDAEFGKAVSSVVTAQTKSGSNKIHGSLFDYRTSTANLAKDPFQQFPATATTPASNLAPGLKNQFGGSIGGKIITDKLFYFGDYQGARQRVGTSAQSIVPTALATSTCTAASGFCDLSDYLNTVYGTTKVGDTTVPTYRVFQHDGTPYANNQIPVTELSAPAVAYLKLLASYTPNKASTAGGPLDEYAQGGTGIFNSDQWDVRGDYQLSQSIHTFGRFSRFTDTLTGNTLFGPAGGPGFGLGNYGGASKGANDSLALGADVAINPTTTTDFRLGYYRYNVIDHKYNQGVAFATNLGFGGLNIPGNDFTSGAPGFQIQMPGGTGEWGAGLNINRCNCPLTEKEDQFQVVNNWTKALGNHSIKLGVDLRYARNLRVPSDTDRTGLFNFNQQTTSLGGVGGLGLASFLLGETTTYGRYVSTSTNAKEFQKRDFFYAQDTWRASQKLTVNYGLRYEYYSPESVNGKGNGALMDLSTGYLHVAGYGSNGSNMGWSAGKNTYNPRLGVAYQWDPKTVIRAGYGRSFDLGVFGSIFGHVVTQNLPVLANQEINTGQQDATNYVLPFSLTGGPPTNVTPAIPSNGLLPNPGAEVGSKARPTPLRLPTLDAWNFSVQRAISPTISVTVAYVGNKGTHTLSAGDGNNTNPNEAAIGLPAQFSVIGQGLHFDPSVSSTAVFAPQYSAFPGISPNGGTANTNYLLRYYGGSLAACSDAAYTTPAGVSAGSCGWNQGIGYYGDDQDTHFNALQVTVAKQMTHGLSFNANYAWQHGINYNSSYATWNKAFTKGPDDSIRRQQIVAYGLYQLPFGHGKQFLGNANRIVDEIIGGWQLSPVMNYSSGLPFTLSDSQCGNAAPSSAPCYVVGNGKALHSNLSGLDTNSHTRTYYKAQPLDGSTGFTAALLDQIGTSGRNSNWGPGFFNTDIALEKNFPIHERLSAKFRMDAFNAFNHINPGNPGGNIQQDGTIGSGSGGVGVASPRQLAFSARIEF